MWSTSRETSARQLKPRSSSFYGAISPKPIDHPCVDLATKVTFGERVRLSGKSKQALLQRVEKVLVSPHRDLYRNGFVKPKLSEITRAPGSEFSSPFDGEWAWQEPTNGGLGSLSDLWQQSWVSLVTRTPFLYGLNLAIY